jgi:hypothetical protein
MLLFNFIALGVGRGRAPCAGNAAIAASLRLALGARFAIRFLASSKPGFARDRNAWGSFVVDESAGVVASLNFATRDVLLAYW